MDFNKLVGEIGQRMQSPRYPNDIIQASPHFGSTCWIVSSVRGCNACGCKPGELHRDECSHVAKLIADYEADGGFHRTLPG